MRAAREVRERLEATREAARRTLLAAYDGGAFRGALSSSPLSTATAVIALELRRRAHPAEERDLAAPIRDGVAWLRDRAGPDGGFGDTVDSPSNVSTTALAWAALGLADDARSTAVAGDAARWIERHAGGTDERSLARALAERYGGDLTFSVPILTACALAGRFGDRPEAWRAFPALPFELAAFPRRWFRRLGIPVVSYALPALIALGQVRHARAPSRNPAARLARSLARRRTLSLLEEIQPANGGFLEATPLTAFVLMSLVGIGRGGAVVARRATEFLIASARDDGSWPIDTNLDTWTTTLAVKALAAGGAARPVEDARAAEIVRWLLDQQGAAEHPYTLAAPGAWAWTDLPGGVPDADDTPGALLALRILAGDSSEVRVRAVEGVRWLVDLANRDGGVPTFCRGFGKLPFDRSSPDLTAHALRAWRAWRDDLDPPLRRRVDAARAAAVRYLTATQAEDGTWTPLWFGNQGAPREENPLYGTAQVVLALLDEVGDDARAREAAARAVRWIVAAQADDGGFGGAPGTPPSVEETGVALLALAEARRREETAPLVPDRAIFAAAEHLASTTRDGAAFPAAPIGLYFARLWYAERLYPVLFALAGLESASLAIER